MIPYQKIINGALLIAGLSGLLGCEYKPLGPKANQDKKKVILEIPVAIYGGRAIAAGDMDNDGLTDILSTDDGGRVYFHKNLGKGKFKKFEKPILNVPTDIYGARAIAAGDMDNDGLTDILSTDNAGRVYFHKNLGNMKFE